MSIAVLTQVYDETRRLAIAGSNVAPGDFRLKKLIPPLEQAGAKAPVFAKVAQAVQSVVDSNEKTAPNALLELSSLVNSILYTQGETGCAGEMKPLETQDLGQQVTRTSARMLKPLLEALTTTGGGRIEVIRDAIERGLFSDLRLVRHALNALDDTYSEITELIADKVLPQYGRAIIPELRAKLDLKGKNAGQLSRLKLLHRIDAEGSRALVEEALDKGSKEMKVVAIECLGTSDDDLDFLVEQSTAAASDVRGAALASLARLDADAAVAAIERALCGPDIDLAVFPVQQNRNARLLDFVLRQAEEELDSLLKSKGRTKGNAPKHAVRLTSLLESLRARDDPASATFLLKVFGSRDELAAIKGEPGGADVVDHVILLLAFGPPAKQKALVEAHAELSAFHLAHAFMTAIRLLKPAQVYDRFAHYLLAKVDEKKKGNESAFAKRDAIRERLISPYFLFGGPVILDRQPVKWDPRWLEAAVRIRDRELVCELIRPDSPAAKKFLAEEFDELMASQTNRADNLQKARRVISAMAKCGHPRTVACVVTLIDLPKSVIPKIEKLSLNLEGKGVDELIAAILELTKNSDVAEK